MNRRNFLKLSAATLALTSLGTASFAADIVNKKRRVGLIGTGWYGKCDLIRLIQVAPVEVVSLCDPDEQMLSGAADIIQNRQDSKKRPRTYADYRAMLKEKDLDIVLIATPDHWHALPAIEAMQAGAHLYLQKPVSVDVTEGQAILAAARKYKRVVQVGTQRRSTPHLIEAKENIIKAGKLGKIGHVELYCYYHMRTRDNPADSPAPDHLDYEMWTGPAPMRPYNRLVHPRGWRAFMEYSNGIVGDMCIHMLDAARWLLDLGAPTRISSTGGIYIHDQSKSNIADSQTATFSFDGLDMVWNHRTWGTAPDPKYPWGLTIYGEKGTLKASVMSYDFIPQGQGETIHKDVTYEFEQYPEDKVEKDLERHVAPAIRRHMLDMLASIDKGTRPVADIEEGYISTAACILANNSMKLGRSIRWDPVNGRVVGDEEANRLLSRPYRGPWVHPDASRV